jgi:hypothetical protein
LPQKEEGEVGSMRKGIAASLVIFLTVATTAAQKSEAPKLSVAWSPDANCHPANSPEVKELNPKCSSVTIENTTFYIIELAGVSYAMANRPVRDFLVASVQISNKSASAVEVNPKRSRLGRFMTADEFAANAKTEYEVPQSQDALRRATYRESEVIGEKDGHIRSGLRVRDRFEPDMNRGRIIRRPGAQIEEPAAPQTEAPAPSTVTSNVLVPRSIFDNILKSKTLAAGEKTAGHLVFRNLEEDKRYLVWRLNVGRTDFVFTTMSK